MKLFDIVEKRVIINENILLIPTFKRVVDKYGDKCLDVFCFIHYYCNYKSPFFEYTDENKEEKLMELYNPDGIFTMEDPEIIEAMKLYNEIQWTPTMELVEAAKIMIHKMAAYLKTASLTDGKDGNITQIGNIMKQLGPNVASYDELKEHVEKEKAKANVYGGKHVSSRER